MVCRPSHHCGDAFRTVDAPYLGTPAIEQEAGPGPCCAERPAGETPPPVMSLADCPPCPGPLPGALDEVAAALRDVQERFRLNIPGILDGPVAINIASRNLVLKTAVPSAGPFYPQTVLTYNSQAARRCIQYGAGWANLFHQTVRVACGDSQSAEIIKGDGSCWRYTDLDASGYYLAPTRPRIPCSAPATAGWRRSPTACNCTTSSSSTPRANPPGWDAWSSCNATTRSGR